MTSRPGTRPSRRPAALLVVPALALLLAACGTAEDAARSAASDAASSVGDSVKTAAADQAVDRLCGQTTGSGVLTDGQITPAERAAVVSLSSVASSAGVPQEYAAPLKQVADSTDDATVAKGVEALKKACAGRSGQ
jgi:hypothetical protein